MKIADYKKEAFADAEARKERIFHLVRKSDVDTLRQRKTIFDYLYQRADKQTLNNLSEFDDIIHVVGHFSEQIPDFYKLSHAFVEQNRQAMERTLKTLDERDEDISFKNEIVLEKSERHINALSGSMRNLMSIANVELLTESFTAAFIPPAIAIYESLIALINDFNDPEDHRAHIYKHFDLIVPSLDTLKEDFFKTAQ